MIKRPVAIPPVQLNPDSDARGVITSLPERPASESTQPAVYFQAIFTTADGEPYQGDGPHSVSATELVEVRRMAQRLLQSPHFHQHPAGYRIVDSLGRFIEEWRHTP